MHTGRNPFTCLYNEGSRHEIDEDVNSVMMASGNDQLFLGHAQIVKTCTQDAGVQVGQTTIYEYS
jgi:hypothetical protein